MSGSLSTSNTVFFSTANAGYAIYAATSLLTVRDKCPGAQLYILSAGLSDDDKKILERNDIGYHEIDLRSTFTQTWQYPIECFYIFAGPEIFRKLGFDYSVYIDGDVLCVADPLIGVDDVLGVASAEQNDEYANIFGDDIAVIRDIWGDDIGDGSQKRMNTGVVYFNNQRMQDIALMEKASSLYEKCLERDIPRKGDDSLFALFRYVYLQDDDVLYLPAGYNYTPHYNKWAYPIEGLVFFHFTLGKPWNTEEYQYKGRSSEVFDGYVREWRRVLKSVSWSTWLSAYYKGNIYINVLEAADRVKKLIRDQILWSQGLKKSYFTRLTNSRKRPIRLYWWQDPKNGIINFGDEITRDIIKSIFGYESVLAPIDVCKVMGAGSIIEIATRRNSSNTIHVWGSGCIKEGGSIDAELYNLRFHAVRGLATKNRVGLELPVGDPGLLANLVYQRSHIVTDKIGVVVHYVDNEHPVVRRIYFDPRFVIINPLDSPSEVARKISSCSVVFSSSLHGLIFADSFGIPNVHIKFTDNLTGGDYKFQDYYSATGRKYQRGETDKIFNDNYIAKIHSEYRPIKNLRSIQRGLIKAFPLNVVN